MLKNSITDVPGLMVGHAQDEEAGTGCSVLLCGEGAVAGVDVRGGAPGTREISCLDPVNMIDKANAIYLSGGSAYGLDGASGVMQFLEEKGLGFDVGVGLVPIVPGAVLFDLPVGRADVRPDKEMGYKACLNAVDDNTTQGNVGAGTGASIGKAAGLDMMMKGGLGTASRQVGDLIVGAMVAVNCFGDVLENSKIIAGTLDEKGNFPGSMNVLSKTPVSADVSFTNTTIGIIATNADINKTQATKIAQMGHDGFARGINPIHTAYDGDTIFCVATGKIPADVTTLGGLAAEVMEEAIINGIKAAKSAYGLPCYNDKKERQN